MKAEGNGKAEFAIDEIIAGIPLVEKSDEWGTYVGIYEVTPGIEIKDGIVFVTFTDKAGNVATDTSQKVTINTTVVISSAEILDKKDTYKNGDEIRFKIVTEPGSKVTINVSSLDTTRNEIQLAESSTTKGVYEGSVIISMDNTATEGVKKIVVNVTDKLGNKGTKTIEVVYTQAVGEIYEYTLTLDEGINLMSLPLNPGARWRMSDIAGAIGPEALIIIHHQRNPSRLVGYSQTEDAYDSKYNAKITSSASYFVVMDAPKQVTFKGTAWSGSVALKPGFNFVSLPLDQRRPFYLSEIAALAGEELQKILIYDKTKRKFAGYTLENVDATWEIGGGDGYILYMKDEKTLMFSGVPWQNTPAIAAPILPVASLAKDDGLPLVVINGKIKMEDEDRPLNDLGAAVKNLTKGWTEKTSVDFPGRYVVTHADFEHNRAVNIGDVLEITIFSPSGAFGKETIQYIVSEANIKSGLISSDDIFVYATPKQSALLPSYPNPFNPEVWIPYKLSSDSKVTINIYNIKGKLIRTIELGYKPSGVYIRRYKAAYWDGKNSAGERVASGVYVYQLKAGNFTATRKMILVK